MQNDMKKLTFWQWLAIALVILALVGCIVLVYRAPLAAITLAVGFLVGMATMWMLKKKHIVNK